ncbi:hypothetical protein ABW20_dc0107971 [Dactylellina cionopaga]|nr:hypothetical protein ABW20_dc0107971 [Dactylellina cionopaga]
MDSSEGSGPKSGGGPLGSGNGADFVKKLYRMLSEKNHGDVVRWSDSGASFIVFDNNEFTKNVLPQHFKHSNFASFVRQLNKYDFHKVRASDETAAGPNGDQAWEFVHPEFRLGNDNNLEGIKRKAPSQRQKKESEEPQHTGDTQVVVQQLREQMDDILQRFDHMVQQYHDAMNELMNVNRRWQQTEDRLDRFMRTGQIPADMRPRQNGAFINGHPMHMSPHEPHIQHHHVVSPQQVMAHPMTPHGQPIGPPMHPAATPIQQAERFLQHQHPPPPPPQPPHTPHGHPNGFTEMNGNGVADPVNLSFVAPRWREPPRILLVEDDPTCRKIGLKFLEATGCRAYHAFNDANEPQYDLILMDIVMPNLDGVSTCSIIRNARPDMKDPPIIAMTSNIRTSDINLYFNAGMIDVLPKPFTRDGLLQMLQKYLSNLILNHADGAVAVATQGPNGTLQVPPIMPKQEAKTPTSPMLKTEYDNTTNSHVDDHDHDDDDEVAGHHEHHTPDSSVSVVPSSTLGAPINQNAHHPHHPPAHHHPHHPHHHHHGSTGMDGTSDYTFAELPPSANGGPGGTFASNGTGPGGVDAEVLGAPPIFAPNLGPPPGVVAGPGPLSSSPRGGLRRPMDAAIHEDYGDSRMKRMRFNAA